MGLYVIYTKTPSILNTDGSIRETPGRKVKNFWVGTIRRGDLLVQDWDEQRKFARRFPNKIEAKKIQSKLRMLLGSENCKVESLDRYRKVINYTKCFKQDGKEGL
jgi:hypothetical protein